MCTGGEAPAYETGLIRKGAGGGTVLPVVLRFAATQQAGAVKIRAALLSGSLPPILPASPYGQVSFQNVRAGQVTGLSLTATAYFPNRTSANLASLGGWNAAKAKATAGIRDVCKHYGEQCG